MVRIIHYPKKINIVISLDKNLDTYCKYDKVLLSGDFNSEISDICLDLFPYQHNFNLKNLVEEKTCFKSGSNLICLDPFLTNQVFPSQNPINGSSSLPDFRKYF